MTWTPNSNVPGLHHSHIVAYAWLVCNSTVAREGAMVTVVPETNNAEYKVYKGLLVQHSESFRWALTGPWIEAAQRIVRIGDVESYTRTPISML
jgi:hypothetical protein